MLAVFIFVAYGVGLIITFAALYLMKEGQPALVYLVPSTLLTVIVISLIRKEFCNLWHGTYVSFYLLFIYALNRITFSITLRICTEPYNVKTLLSNFVQFDISIYTLCPSFLLLLLINTISTLPSQPRSPACLLCNVYYPHIF